MAARTVTDIFNPAIARESYAPLTRKPRAPEATDVLLPGSFWMDTTGGSGSEGILYIALVTDVGLTSTTWKQVSSIAF